MGEPEFFSRSGALASMDSLRDRKTVDGVDRGRGPVVVSRISGAATLPRPTANRLAASRRRIGTGTAFIGEYATQRDRRGATGDPGITAGFGSDHLFRIHCDSSPRHPTRG